MTPYQDGDAVRWALYAEAVLRLEVPGEVPVLCVAVEVSDI